MRRLLGLVLASLVLAASAAMAAVGTGNYADDFDKVGYSGSNGTLKWSGDWREINDDGDPADGSVHVGGDGCSGQCAHLENEGLTAVTKPIGLERRADTAVFSSAEISYELAVKSEAGVAGTLVVQVSADDGSNWQTLASHDLSIIEGETIRPTVKINEQHFAESFVVRFLASKLLGGYVFVDEVDIRGELVGSSSTTTSTSTTSTTLSPPATTSAPSSTSTTARATTTSVVTTTTLPRATTTTAQPETSTSDAFAVAGPRQPPTRPGEEEVSAISLRRSQSGMQAGLSDYMFAEADPVPRLDPVAANVGFEMMAETIETSWVWMGLFGLVLTWAVVAGLDRNSFRRVPND